MTSCSASTARQQHRRQILVDDRLDAPDPRRTPVPHHRDPAATARHHDEPGLDQGPHRSGVQHLQRLRRRHDPPPAAVPAVLPDLPVRGHHSGLIRWQVPADRLGRPREAGIARVHQRAGHHRRHRFGDAALGQRGLQRAHDDEAERPLRLRAAPVERHRWHHLRGQLVLHQQVADLRSVPVRQYDLDPGRHQGRDRRHSAPDRGDLVLRPRAAVGSGHGVAAQRDQRPHARRLTASRSRLIPRRRPAGRTPGRGRRTAPAPAPPASPAAGSR